VALVTLLPITGEANIPFPVIPLLLITSSPFGAATLIGAVMFFSAWLPYLDPGEREHNPYLRSETDNEGRDL
jgi:hypothetical protein